MKTKTKVVVVGGGVVGVSALYHLAKKGWSDVVLVERKELTSGSTWHAAGLLPLFNMSYSVGQLHKYAVNLYKTLEEETGKNVGFSVVSNIRLASTKDRMDEYHQYAGVARTIGVDVKFLKPEQVKEIWPLCHTDDLVGAIQHPEDGYIQPADLTQALAIYAIKASAKMRSQNLKSSTITVFTRTSHYSNHAYQKSAHKKLINATDNTNTILKIVVALSKEIYSPEYKLSKAGVLMQDLTNSQYLQQSIINYKSQEKNNKSISLMKTIDSLNKKFNNEAITWAIAKKPQEWKMNRNSLSSGSTTNIKKIPNIMI